LIDTHAHLDFPQYDGDRDAVLRRAWEAGLTGIVTVGTDAASARRAVGLAEAAPRVHAAVGLHPHEAARLADEWEELARLARHPRVVAIGETGLDYHYPDPPPDRQREAFRRQVRLARELGLPVIVHARDAYDEVLRILEEEGVAEVGGVMHCFAADARVAEEALALGLHVSFSGIVTFRNAYQVREAAAWVPLERLLVETDCPFLSPHPYRGQRNEPARVGLVVEEIARLRGLEAAAVARQTGENAVRLFRLPQPRP